MNFVQDKCAHLVIEKGQIRHNGQHLEINDVKIQQVDEGECYKYLGQDENTSYVGTGFVKNTLQELEIFGNRSFRPSIKPSHIMFAVPGLKPTFSILDWTIQEIRNIDIKKQEKF